VRVAVTGATGLVGGHVARAAAAAGHEVIPVVRQGGGQAGGQAGARVARAELDDAGALAAAFEQCEGVVHCAAVYSYDPARAAEVERVNVEGTARVVRAAARAGVRRVVVTSSSVTRGSSAAPVPRTERDTLGAEPAPAYYRSKVAQERAALEAGAADGVEVVLALPTVVLGGPAGRLLPSNAIVLRYLLDATRSTFPGGCNVVDARDVGTGHVLLLGRGEPGERYLLGGADVTWRALHALVAQLAGLPGPFADVPRPVAEAVSWAAQGWARLTGTSPLATREEAATVGRWYWYDHARTAALGYAPGGERAALASALAWLVADGHVPRWVRENLALAPEVRAARPLTPRPLVGS
jgi:dihydroflavonol-4-reductase